MTTRAFALALLAACSSSNAKTDAPPAHDAKTDGKMVDAKVFHDAPPPDAVQHVVMVACPATPAATITTANTADVCSPASATITVNQIVKFQMASSHDVAPGHEPADATIADPGVNVGFGQTACLQFMASGTYGFHCIAHGFDGTITVN